MVETKDTKTAIQSEDRIYESLRRRWPVIGDRHGYRGRRPTAHERRQITEIAESFVGMFDGKTSGLTYFLEAPDLGAVKIGCSSSERIARRIQQIDGASPVRLEVRLVIPGREIERQIHLEFQEWRYKGEWFELDMAMDYFISEMSRLHEDWRAKRAS